MAFDDVHSFDIAMQLPSSAPLFQFCVTVSLLTNYFLSSVNNDFSFSIKGLSLQMRGELRYDNSRRVWRAAPGVPAARRRGPRRGGH